MSFAYVTVRGKLTVAVPTTGGTDFGLLDIVREMLENIATDVDIELESVA